MTELCAFIIKAKKSTYVGNGAKAAATRPGAEVKRRGTMEHHFARLLLSLFCLPIFITASSAACLDVTNMDTQVSLRGQLSQEVLPGPPNYESIDKGDAAEPTWILTLDEAMCVEDGGDFADPSNMFVRVHVYSTDEHIGDQFTPLKGGRVLVQGSAFAAHTIHHRAPLVLNASSVAAE